MNRYIKALARTQNSGNSPKAIYFYFHEDDDDEKRV